jgi:hypothetical protein
MEGQRFKLECCFRTCFCWCSSVGRAPVGKVTSSNLRVPLEFVFAHVAQLVEHPYGRSIVQI